MEYVLNFFDGYTWEQLVGFFFALFFGFLPGFNIFQWLKDKWQIEGEKAHYMVLGGSIVLTVLAMLITGALDLTGFEFTLDNIITLGALVYTGSQIAYKRFQAAQAAEEALPE